MAEDGQGSLISESVEIAFYSVAGTVVTAAVGALSVKLCYVDGSLLKKLAALNLDLLLPALCLSLFPALTAERLARWVVIPICAIMHIAIGCALGRVTAMLLRFGPPRRQLLVLSSGFHNCGAIPFMLAQPIVNNWRRASEIDAPLASINGMIGLYVIVWLLSFSLFGRAYAGTIAENMPPAADTSGSSGAASSSWIGRLVRAFGGPSALVSFAAILLAILLGCVPALHHAFSRGPLQFVGSAWNDLGGAFVTLTVLTLGASLQMAVSEWRTPTWASRASASMRTTVDEVAADDATRVEAVVVTAESTDRGDVTLVCVAIVLKLIMVPLVCVPLTYGAHQIGWLPDEPLLLLVLYITPSLPSSQTALSLLHATGEARIAARLSTLYVPQYLLSTLTIAATVATAVNLIGESPSELGGGTSATSSNS